jgi:hypothetical protein
MIVENYEFNKQKQYRDKDGNIITEDRVLKIIIGGAKRLDVHPAHRHFANFSVEKLLSMEDANLKESHKIDNWEPTEPDPCLKAAIEADSEWLKAERSTGFYKI